MTCEACGATNPDTARWCNQCLAPLGVAERREDGRAGDASAPEPGPPAGTGSGDPTVAGPGPAPEQETTPSERGWPCPVCASATTAPDTACATCGADLAAYYLREGGDERPTPPWAMALVLSALAPGAGHVLLRRPASAAARLLLFLVWALGGIAMLGGGPGAVLAAGPLLLGAAVLWLGSLGDVALASQGAGRELLSARVLLWLVVAVTGLTLLGALASLQLVTS